MVFYKNGDVDITDDLHNIIDRYGESAQVDIAIEEMSELTKALLKYRRNDEYIYRRNELRKDIIEEIADVSIMLEQLKIIFICEADVKQQIIYKVERQLRRIKTEANNE